MGSLQTKIQILNMTLDHLKEQPMSSPTDNTQIGAWFARNYDQQRDFLLERANWKFAKTRVSLSADATAPAFGWTTRYLVPSDNLRIIPPTYYGKWMGTPVPYELEADSLGDMYILTNFADGPLYLHYIQRVTNEGRFTNGFCELFSMRMARRLAHFVTGKASFVNTIDALYKQTWDEVRENELFQTLGGQYYDTDITDERESIY